MVLFSEIRQCVKDCLAPWNINRNIINCIFCRTHLICSLLAYWLKYKPRERKKKSVEKIAHINSEGALHVSTFFREAHQCFASSSVSPFKTILRGIRFFLEILYGSKMYSIAVWPLLVLRFKIENATNQKKLLIKSQAANYSLGSCTNLVWLSSMPFANTTKSNISENWMKMTSARNFIDIIHRNVQFTLR